MSDLMQQLRGGEGWGYTNRPSKDCTIPCYYSRCAGCCALQYWYAPFSAAEGFNQSTWHFAPCEWHTDESSVESIPVRFSQQCTCCTDRKVTVRGSDEKELGHVIRYWYCLPPCEDRVRVEAITAEGESRYTLWEKSCADQCKQCPDSCKTCVEKCPSRCCNWMEFDTALQGPKELGPQNQKGAVTMRLHMCAHCFGVWIGFRAWPEDASKRDKALLIGMAHALQPMI